MVRGGGRGGEVCYDFCAACPKEGIVYGGCIEKVDQRFVGRCRRGRSRFRFGALLGGGIAGCLSVGSSLPFWRWDAWESMACRCPVAAKVPLARIDRQSYLRGSNGVRHGDAPAWSGGDDTADLRRILYHVVLTDVLAVSHQRCTAWPCGTSWV